MTRPATAARSSSSVLVHLMAAAISTALLALVLSMAGCVTRPEEVVRTVEAQGLTNVRPGEVPTPAESAVNGAGFSCSEQSEESLTMLQRGIEDVRQGRVRRLAPDELLDSGEDDQE